MTRTSGICGHHGLSIGDASSLSTIDSDENLLTSGIYVPPSVVVSDTKRRHYTADLHGADLRGSGLAWPPIARISRNPGVARLPAAIAWQALVLGSTGWRCSPSDPEAIESRFAESIAKIASSILEDRQCHAVLAVPDALSPEKQEELIRTCRYEGIDIRLLWRPIASAIMWIEQRAEWLSRQPMVGVSAGHIYVIHMGADVLECTPVEVVWHDESRRFVPARRLPSGDARAHSVVDHGLRLVEDAAEYAADINTDAAWNLVWTSMLLPGTGHESVAGRQHPLHDHNVMNVARESLQMEQYNSRQHPIGESLGEVRTHVYGCGTSGRSDSSWRDFVDSLRSTRAERIVGVVATGMHGCKATSYPGLHTVLNVLELSDSDVLCWADWPEKISAGAAIYSSRVAQGEPGYLDTIPIVETLVTKRGEPAWIDLTDQAGLDQQERFVPGGQTWSRTAKDIGLSIPKESDHLTLTMFKEDNEFVRESTTSFEPARETAEVDLRISLDPGQGLPKLEVIPRQQRAFTSQRLVLDWARESDTGKTKEKAADEIPRTNPPIQPRLASRDCWNGGAYGRYNYEPVKGMMKRITAELRKDTLLNDDRLALLSDALRERDHAYRFKTNGPEHATAIGSDGRVNGGPEDERILHDFVAVADKHLAIGKHEKILTRILGYCSASEENAPNLFALLRTRLSSAMRHKRPSDDIDQDTLNAIGGCLRTPEDVKDYGLVMSKHLDDRGGTNRWLRAMARILQYREDALEEFESESAEYLVEQCHEILRKELSADSAKYIYRHSSLCIVYFLRRRRYDSLFLDPQGELGLSIKRTFSRAIELFDENRLDTVGGFVSLPGVTRMMIDYIDRKGRGRLESVE